MTEELRKVKYLSPEVFSMNQKDISQTENVEQGYFHAWLIKEDISMALIEREDGKMIKVYSDNVQFIK